MKKVVISGFALLLLTIGVTYYLVNKSTKTNSNLLTSSIKVGQLYVKTRISEDVDVSDLPANVQKVKIKNLLEKQVLEYKSVGNLHFDIQEFKDLNYGDTSLQDDNTGSAPNADFEEDPTMPKENMDLVTDPRVVVKGENTAYMLVKDFDFENGIDYVQYKGIVLEITKASVPESYSDMKINPDSIYDYTKYQIGEGYIDVLFESVKEGKNIVVRVYNKDGKITGYEVLE